jgi:hypothetical protein
LSVGTLRSEDPAETEARRLTRCSHLLTEEALIQGRDFGVEFFEDGYRFLSWDPDSGLWSVVDDEEALRRRTLPPDGCAWSLAVDGREVVVDSEDKRRDPSPGRNRAAGGRVLQRRVHTLRAVPRHRPGQRCLAGAGPDAGDLEVIAPEDPR